MFYELLGLMGIFRFLDMLRYEGGSSRCVVGIAYNLVKRLKIRILTECI